MKGVENNLFRAEVESRIDLLIESGKNTQTYILEEATGNDIQALCQHQAVYRSAHIGNLFSSNIVAGKLGARFVLFDRNTQKEDENNHPSYLILNKSFGRIGDESFDGSFSPFTPFANEGPAVDYVNKRSLSPANFHLQEARKVFPGQIETQSEYFENNREIVERVIYILMKRLDYAKFYALFDRSLTYKGEPVMANNFDFFDRNKFIQRFFAINKTFIDASELGPENVELPENRPIPNTLFIAFASVFVEAAKQYQEGKTDLSVVYHLSGPDMYRYIVRMQEKISILYDVAKSEIALPRQTMFAVIPTAHLRLITSSENELAMNSLIHGIEIQQYANRLKKQGVSDPALVADLKRIARNTVKDSLVKTKVDLKSKLSNHFNQHNMYPGEIGYVHPLLLTQRSVELEDIYRQIVAIDSNGK